MPSIDEVDSQFTFYFLSFSVNDVTPSVGKLNKLSIHRAGIFIVVEAPGMGLQVKWDRGTRAYVKLGIRWKNRVQGLCGNFNGDAQDDLKTPSSGIETSAILFGDSWKLQDFCASKLLLHSRHG